MDYLDWDMAFLTRYICNCITSLLDNSVAVVTELAFKVAESNCARNPEIKAVADLEVAGKRLNRKGNGEEKELFPYIIALYDASVKGTRLNPAAFDQSPSRLMI